MTISDHIILGSPIKGLVKKKNTSPLTKIGLFLKFFAWQLLIGNNPPFFVLPRTRYFYLRLHGIFL